MSKRKFGFSILTTFALMLMFGIVAMAAAVGVSNLKATVDNAGVLKATWAADTSSGVTGYTVTVTKASDNSVVDTKTDVTTSYTLTVDSNTIYNVEVKTNGGANDTGTTTISGVKYRYNNPLTSTDKDNGLDNANHTGKNVTTNDGSTVQDVIKSKGMTKNDGTSGNHRTHGEYQNNTNSCASCHQTHTAASKSLLFKDGVYNTCTACHDGTLGFYNVFQPSNAGTFGGTHQGNMSVHLADGSVQLKAAPGGNGAANTGSWINEFNCASCHSPHGSYSDRLLHYNPNSMGLAKTADGGIGIVGGTISNFGSLPDANLTSAEKYIIVRGTATELGLVAADIAGQDPATTKVLTVFEDTGATYTKSTNPWLYGYVYGSPKKYYTKFYKVANDFTKDASGTDYVNITDFHDEDTNKVEFNFEKGFVFATTGNEAYINDMVTGDVGRAYTVKLDLTQVASFGGVPIYRSDSNKIMEASSTQFPEWVGAGAKISAYCASCHTDYLAKSGSATGTFSKAYRHTTNNDEFTCVRCHYAHGTDVTVMMDAHNQKLGDLTKAGGQFDGDTTKATNYLLDTNASSALKRYTNMAVCWGCHTSSKAEQLRNNSAYDGGMTGTTTGDPHGLEEQPSVGGQISQKAIDSGNVTLSDPADADTPVVPGN